MSLVLPPTAATWYWAERADALTSCIYLQSAYQQLFARLDGSVARCLCVRERSGQEWALPLLQREIGNGRYEAYSAYGYGGCSGPMLLDASKLAALRATLAAEGIVALFLRHAPFLGNHEGWPQAQLQLNRWTYASQLPVDSSFDDYVRRLPQKLRWSLNYALRAGLQLRFLPFDANLDCGEFYRLYAALMQAKGTADYYLFSPAFFAAHVQQLGPACQLAEVRDPASGELLAAAFFLADSSGWVHYHLSAASEQGMRRQAMEYLLLGAIQHFGALGYQQLHLGGGLRLDESDGLSRFKQKFATQRLPFYLTQLVTDEAGYQAERQRLPLQHANFFLIADARGA